MIKISTSILSATNRIESIKKLNKTNTEYIHIDVMDGIFVTNKQFSINEINSIKEYANKPIDLHLMTQNPEYYIDNINKNNIEYITIHLEINQDINHLIKKIKSYGIKVGIAINPQTDIIKINQYIDKIDMVLIMSVNPGFGGQQFIETTIEKIKNLKLNNKSITIEVDGGINKKTINLIKPYANIAVVGSYITNNEDYSQAINNLKN